MLPSFFFLLFLVWTSLDRTIPMWDAAYHLADGYSTRDLLLEHICLKKKLLAILKISTWYPPLFQWVLCFFLLMPVPSSLAERLPAIAFYGIGIFAIYRLGRLLCNDPTIASVAASIYATIPVVCTCTHSRGLLDTPLTSMCMLAIWLMARWNLSQTLANSLILGLAVGLTCLTKQTGILYLMPPVILLVIQRIRLGDFAALKKLTYGLALGGVLYLSWFLPNLYGIRKELDQWVDSFSYLGSGLPLWFRQMNFYLIDKAPKCLSLPLTIVFVVSLFNLRAQRNLRLPASTFIGFFILCAFCWDARTFRYALPIVGYISLSSAALLVDFWRSGRVLLKAFDISFAVYLLALYFSISFTPYPFPRPNLAYALGLNFVGLGCVCAGCFPAWPWIERPAGYDWLINEFASEKVENRSDLMLGSNREYPPYEKVTQYVMSTHLPRPIIVMLGPNVEFYSIEYLARLRALPVIFTPLVEPRSGMRLFYDPGPDWLLTRKEDVDFTLARLTIGFGKFRGAKRFVKVGECEVYDPYLFPPRVNTLVLYRNMPSKQNSGNLHFTTRGAGKSLSP